MSAAWLVEALVASGLLMAAVLVLRAPVRRWFGPQVAYALWALPVLRLFLPPIPAGWREAAATPMARVGETITVLVVPVAEQPVAAAAGGPSLATLLLGGWAVGALLFLAWHAGRHRRFCQRLLRSAEWIEERQGVAVIASDAAAGPLAFGIRNRYVAFPRDFAARYDAEERQLALAHELGHHARGDLIANWAALVVLALHWCNPLAWRAFRAFRCDQELANDARVLAGRSRADRHAYACAIVKAAHGGAVSAACHLHTIEDLKGRLRMLTTTRFSRGRMLGGAATVSMLGTLGLALTVSGSEAAAAISETVSAGVEQARAAAPATPATPATPEVPAAPASGKRAPVTRVTVVKDGKTKTYTGAEAEAYTLANVQPLPPLPPLAPLKAFLARPMTPPVRLADGRSIFSMDGDYIRVVTSKDGSFVVNPPEVTARDCRDDEGGGRQTSFTTEKDGRSVIVICNNRIEQQVASAAQISRNAATMARYTAQLERGSIRSARMGLTTARASLLASRDLSETSRREALAGIDVALAELRDVSGAAD